MDNEQFIEFLYSIGFEEIDHPNERHKNTYSLKGIEVIPDYCFVTITINNEIEVSTSINGSFTVSPIGKITENIKYGIIDYIIYKFGFIPNNFRNFIREEKIKTILE